MLHVALLESNTYSLTVTGEINALLGSRYRKITFRDNGSGYAGLIRIQECRYRAKTDIV